ncbi:peptide deformylase [Gammaproteobacteria bacterium]|jgi:peptide deformylase|nr:peptide deformylase [Gammaproteobacteria bacterium]MDB4252872.1 peptide deformylase [Gammaproteobacteria bacterium]MDB9997031.1 peptide deformylase [Gammaproteobacteria bacterium]MDC1491452.1 peptide deformylase [Gammaproteobacteria bacterium]|tara:strand:- start:913 stop:1404 length:492 start_codon:yes stop_codon:yes gene_type:complete
MAILKILKYPDPRLRTVAENVILFDKSLKNLSKDMLETMYAENGIGLAATQVDIHTRLIVMDISDDRNEPMIFVNPVVTVLDNKSLVPCEEGCLSIPGASVEVSRPDKIKLNWLDLSGKDHESFPEGLLAVCIQHEIDHLQGKLLVDYLSPLKRARLKDKATK